MNAAEQEAILHLQNLINSNVNKEEILFYLEESFPNYATYLSNAASDVTLSVSDVLIFLKDVPDAFAGICEILSGECQQSFIVDSLREYISVYSTETDTAPSENITIPEGLITRQLSILQLSQTSHIHANLVNEIVADILSHQIKEIVITGPKGSGKTALIRDIQHRLHLNHTFECLHLDLEAKRFSFVLGELDYFVGRKTFTDKKAIFLDSCDHGSLLRLMDGSDCSIYQEAKLKGIVIFFTLIDVNVSDLLPNAKKYDMPTCSNDQIEEILTSNFDFSGGKYESLKTSIQKYPHYPLHVILMGSLFISVKESHFEFLKKLPSLDDDKDFVKQTLKAIVDVRNSFDEMHVIASVAMYHDVGGAYDLNVTFLLSKLKYDEELISQCLDSLVECKLLIIIDERYFLYANFLKPLMTIDQFRDKIWNKLLAHFCLEYLRYCEIIIESLNDDKNLSKQWSNVKRFVIKALTHNIPVTDEAFSSIFLLRCSIVSKLKLLWQARFLTFIECVDIYETVTTMIENGKSSGQVPKILSWERTILIQYVSLFFYFQKVTENKELLSIIFSNIDKVNQSLSNPSDELSCELVNLIIEYRIQEGMLEDAMKYLKALIKMQQEMDISKDSVALSKIRLAQIKILKHENLDFENEEMLGDNFSCTPLGRPQLISTKIRMSRGDLYYMQNDFVTTGWNYEMALYGLDDLNSDNLYLQGEYSKQKQNIHCRLGKLGLQSNERDELAKSLQHFGKCQELNQSIEAGSKYHKYFVYSAVTHMLMGDNSKALYEILDYMKYTPHKAMFIAVTDLDAQQIISRNLQERLEGNELQFIDNHVYQGKVNFLHLIRTNYDWVKNQANDEIIEIDLDISEKVVRANVLQFPNQMSQSNKCLVVVFLESQHQRHYSDRTNVSEQTNISLSSFRSEIIDPESDHDVDDDSPHNNQSRQPRSIVDTVYHHSLNIARDVVDRAKTGFIESLTTSIFDRIF